MWLPEINRRRRRHCRRRSANHHHQFGQAHKFLLIRVLWNPADPGKNYTIYPKSSTASQSSVPGPYAANLSNSAFFPQCSLPASVSPSTRHKYYQYSGLRRQYY